MCFVNNKLLINTFIWKPLINRVNIKYRFSLPTINNTNVILNWHPKSEWETTASWFMINKCDQSCNKHKSIKVTQNKYKKHSSLFSDSNIITLKIIQSYGGNVVTVIVTWLTDLICVQYYQFCRVPYEVVKIVVCRSSSASFSLL
jgi:hypothetical protein